MQTTLKHEKNELLLYVGLGASKAILLYPFWLFKSKGTKSTTAFGGFKTPRGWGWHLGLFGFQVFEQKTAKRAKNEEPEIGSPIFWNDGNELVQDHRDGTVDWPKTHAERERRGLPALSEFTEKLALPEPAPAAAHTD